MNKIYSKKIIYMIVGTLILMSCFILYFYHQKNTNTESVNSEISAVSVTVPVHLAIMPESLNIARRRGVCRTMNTHLVNFSVAKDSEQAEQSYKALNSLASGMINYYSFDDSQEEDMQIQTLASPKIWTNKTEFREARQQLIEALQDNKNTTEYQTVSKEIKSSCENCHQQFLKVSTE